MSNPILTETEKIVVNIYSYLEQQRKIPHSLEYKQNITDLDKYIAEITGLPESIIKRITCGKKNILKQTDHQKKIILIDESDLLVIKGIVNRFYEEANKLPSLQNLQNVLCTENIVDCGIKDLSTLLHYLGFNYRKYDSSKVKVEFSLDENRGPCRAKLQECDSSSQDECSLDSL